MSYLKKYRQNNLKNYQRCAHFLQAKGYDINNLPAIQAKRPTIQVKQQTKASIKQQTGASEESDSEDFDMIEYIKAKKQANHQSSHSELTNHRNQSKQRDQTPFDFSQYSYNENTAKEETKYQFKKAPKFKQKEVFRTKWRVIDKQEYKNKVKIYQAIKNIQPLRRNYKIADNKEWQNYKKHEDHKLYYILSKFPRIKEFKNNQKAIIKCGLQNHNIFVCMPTGGGKSLTFQILTFLIKGVYLCILPLISLIFDQQYQAKILGIQAYSLTANTTQSDVKMIYNKLHNFNKCEKSIVIFCTPQKLNLSPAFSEVLEDLYHQDNLKRVVIDEVHCVSTWGKQFRIQYQNLSSLKKKFPKTPILALTATVTEVVKQDIISKLGIQNCFFFQSSFNRPNLYYEVRNKDKNVFPDIEAIITKYRNKSGIIYCLSRKACEQTSQKLNSKGYKTAFYHADIAEEQKKIIQERWMRNQIYIIVATVAFGMGINKPDVRFVIHHSMSKSLENYYQESGRAGRDGQYSQCILFYRKLDKQFLMNMTLKNDFSTKENKEFSTKQLAQMIKYCEDKATCRREFQLRYLGQVDFTAEQCHKTCDNCKKNRLFEDFECIDEAKLIIRTLLRIQEFKISISKNQVISIVKNKLQKNKTLKYKLPHLQRAGIQIDQLQRSFEEWKVDQLQLLILQFMSNDLLTERIVQNQVQKNMTQNSFSNVYLKCNVPKCRIFLEKVETLPLKRQVKIKQSKKSNQYSQEQITQEFDQCISEQKQEFSSVPLSGLLDQQNEKTQRYKIILQSLFQEED